jgi:hypothetical protein
MRAKTSVLIVAIMMVAACGTGYAQQRPPLIGDEAPLQTSVFACQDWNEYERIIGYLIQHDSDAFNKALAQAIRLGNCTVFEKGEIAFIADAGFTSVKLRRRGETVEYWTTRTATDPVAKSQDEKQK